MTMNVPPAITSQSQWKQTDLKQFFTAQPSKPLTMKVSTSTQLQPSATTLMVSDIEQRRTLLNLWNEVMAKLQLLANKGRFNRQRVFWGYFLQTFRKVFGNAQPIFDRIQDCVYKKVPTEVLPILRLVWLRTLNGINRESLFNIGIEVGAFIEIAWKKSGVQIPFHRFNELVQACLVLTYLVTLPPIGASLMMQQVLKDIARKEEEEVYQKLSEEEAKKQSEVAMNAQVRMPRIWPPPFDYPPYPNPSGPPKSVFGNPIIPSTFKPTPPVELYPPPPPLTGGVASIRKTRSKSKSSVRRYSKSRLSSNRSTSRSKSKSEFIEVESLPPIKLDDRTIEQYQVVSPSSSLVGKVARYGVLAWTPEKYDYETNKSIVSKLYVFRNETQRDDFQQTLYDEAPGLYLQSYKFSKPILVRSRLASR